MITHLFIYEIAFTGRNFHATQRKSLEIQTCSIAIRRTLSSWNIVKRQLSSYKLHMMKLVPEKERYYLILECDYVTWKPRIRENNRVTFFGKPISSQKSKIFKVSENPFDQMKEELCGWCPGLSYSFVCEYTDASVHSSSAQLRPPPPPLPWTL